MKCQVHPKYKGLREPRIALTMHNLTFCTCWRIYLKKHPNKKYPNFITGKPMSYNDWGKAGAEAGKKLKPFLNK